MAGAKDIAVSVAAIHIGEKSVAIWEQFPERGRAISHPFDIFQLLLKKQIILLLWAFCSLHSQKGQGTFCPKTCCPIFARWTFCPPRFLCMLVIYSDKENINT